MKSFLSKEGMVRFFPSGKFLAILALAGFFVFGGFAAAKAEQIAITEDTVWDKAEVRIIENDNELMIMPGAKLTINPGTIIKLGQNSSISSIGDLEVHGSAEEPVIFTSLKDDEAGGDTNADGDASSPARSDWNSISLYRDEGVTSLNMDYAIIKYANIAVLSFEVDDLVISHSLITDNFGGIILIGATGNSRIEYSNIFNNYDPVNGSRTIDGITFYLDVGVYNTGESLVNAPNNYWGSPEGPSLVAGFTGLQDLKGAFIGGNCNYQPFSTEPWEIKTQPEALDPVILVPGIMGSWQSLNIWVIDPILHTYDNLIEAMIQSGYELNENLFLFPYNWRQDNVITGGELKEKIAAVKILTGSEKVDIVAHSMGGLVARSYIQGSDYQNDVDQVIFLATPHQGAPEDYLVWEGSYFKGGISSLVVKAAILLEATVNKYIDLLDYIHEQIPSARQLLPVYNYLQNKQNNNWIDRIYPVQYPRNEFLENLNVPVGTSALEERTDAINMFSHAPEVDSTLNKIKVVNDLDIYDSQWFDGYPEDLEEGGLNWGSWGDGDGTVPIESSNSLDEAEAIEFNGYDHRTIVTGAQKEVIEKLTGSRPDNFVSGKWAAIKRILMFRIFSPADFVIIAPDGKRLGKDFLTGQPVGEIEGAFYSGFNSDAEFATIPDPMDGEYRVELQGTGSGGEYKLSVSLIEEDSATDKEYTASIQSGAVQEFKLNYNEENEEPFSELEPEDTVPPAITINAPVEHSEFTRNEIMEINYSVTDDFSGVASSTVKIDGEVIAAFDSVALASTTVDMFNYKTGAHILEIIAEDLAGNEFSLSLNFNVIASLDSAISAVKKMYSLGWITDRTTAKILEREFLDVKRRLEIFEQERAVIRKNLGKIEQSYPANSKTKAKLIQRYNEELDRIEVKEDKYLGSAFDQPEKTLPKYLKKGMINQQAYDIISSDINYLKSNL